MTALVFGRVALLAAVVTGFVLDGPAGAEVGSKKPVKAAKTTKAAKAKAAAKPVQEAIPEDGSKKAIKACKEHVDRVMKSPTGTTHAPDADLKVSDHGAAKYTVAGVVSGNRQGGAHIKADWECEVEQVGAGLMHTKTKLFLPD